MGNHELEKMKGKVKKLSGKLNNDRKMEAEGKYQEEKAKLKDNLGL